MTLHADHLSKRLQAQGTSSVNMEPVVQAYDMFVKNHVTDALNLCCTEDVEWTMIGKEADIPWAGTFKGRRAVEEHMFKQRARFIRMLDIETGPFIKSKDGKHVTVTGTYTYTPVAALNQAGGPVPEYTFEWAHIITLANDGRIAKLVAYPDTWMIVQTLKDAKAAVAASRYGTRLSFDAR
ncbi:hypothetical protein WJX72_009507 [[Myrmecia] bisecta]|uniref:SnoaL-like domain-containing protein n=1 Tax=[Myrmecia] bisecta TaxID=41462 RepID=A0AAW1PA09_9CHLO